MRVKLVVAYDGTAYHGWQYQPGVPTIEGELNKALTELLREEIVVIGASRTDAGVHARCNVAVFDTQTRIPAEKITYAVNQHLPEDIVVQSSCEVADDFHPRHVDSRKTYEYTIYHSDLPMPDKRLYSHFVYGPINILAMQEAAAYLVGEHDFASFCSSGSTAETTVRTVYGVEVEEKGELITIRVSGAGFLYNMVRIIAGTLLEVGQGKREPDSMTALINECDRSKAGPTLPANGLMLTRYEFL